MSKKGIRAMIISAFIGLLIWTALICAYLRTVGVFPMIDFARKPARQQAVRLGPVTAFIRRMCYLLAQKGDPS